MSNEGNIKTPILLMLHFRVSVVGYSNGNESSTGRIFSNCGLLNLLFQFFSISHLECFSQDFCQKVYEETILFHLKFQKSISRYSILQKIRISNFVILKWRPFEYKGKKLNNLFTFGTVFSEIQNANILNFSWIKYFDNDFSFLIKEHIRVTFCWN